MIPIEVLLVMTVGKVCLPGAMLRNKSPVAGVTQYSSDSATMELAQRRATAH